VGSEQYRRLCAAFYLGLSALQSGEDVHSRQGLTEATMIAPGEPAGWADLGLLQFRQQNFEQAFQSVQKAQSLIPDNSRIEALLGTIESRRGHTAEALSHFRRAVALDPSNLKALYSLAQETERQPASDSDAKAQQILEQILSKRPNNLAVLVDVIRLSAKRNDPAALRKELAGLEKNDSLLPDAARQRLALLKAQAAADNVRPAAMQAQFLRNVLISLPAYRQSLDEVKTPATVAGEPFVKFLLLPSPSSEPSATDTALRFEAEDLSGCPAKNQIEWIGTFVANEQRIAQPICIAENMLYIGETVRLPLPRASSSSTGLLPRHSVLTVDLNYDFKNDLVVATTGGLRFYQQDTPDRFLDVTAKTAAPASILNGSYTGAWAFDIDLDGDLDVVLGTVAGPVIVLRNNGDGTFAVIRPFSGVEGLTDFASADIDGDGDPDVAILDRAGHLKLFANERLGQYRLQPTPAELDRHLLSLAAADIDGDGASDFLMLDDHGQVTRLSDQEDGKSWTAAKLFSAKTAEQPSIEIADFDNNGALDLLVNGQPFLATAHGFTALTSPLLPVIGDVMETSDGRLNPIGLSAQGSATQLVNRGTKHYNWQDIRAKAATTSGDQRINSFGIGGEMQIRSQLLAQTQIIASPLLHFGLGDHPAAQFVRIEWPNGLIQTEFDPKPNQVLLAEQRLKGSCPFLYTWNGCEIKFLKDVAPMSAALGSHDANDKVERIEQTEGWFKISDRDLKAHEGSLDLRLTDEYWESYFIDRYALTAIDHPADTELLVDERVATPPVPLRTYLVSPPHSFAAARDEHGNDVRPVIEKHDSKYVDTFSPGAYEGITQKHWVELELPSDAPVQGPLYLVGDGWLHPWDEATLIAVNQGKHEKPEDLSIEVSTRDGDWKVVRRNLGVPAGREKTVVIDLSGIFEPGTPRRFRLCTNLELYWDRLQWAVPSPAGMRQYPLTLQTATLEHRGFSVIPNPNLRAPEIPEYQKLEASGKRWHPIEGFYTRYGDVRPLLEASDDRYVIVASGDELRMRFEPPPTAQGNWVRDYVLSGDGWIKEGDYSFEQSSTLLPLPNHSMKEYTGKATTLDDDPTYRKHEADWREYHTRYIPMQNFSADLFSRRSSH
jgi:Flp pilus assembly protein TadD